MMSRRMRVHATYACDGRETPGCKAPGLVTPAAVEQRPGRTSLEEIPRQTRWSREAAPNGRSSLRSGLRSASFRAMRVSCGVAWIELVLSGGVRSFRFIVVRHFRRDGRV